jgi:PhnB protein
MAAPEGYSTVSVYLVAPEADRIVAFAEAVFGARLRTEPMRHETGAIGHAELVIGDSVVMVGSWPDGDRRSTAMLHVYVDDCDATYAAALDAGATSDMAPADQSYGDRRAGVRDLAGNLWWIAQRLDAG